MGRLSKTSNCGSEYEEEERLGICSVFRSGNDVKANVKKNEKSAADRPLVMKRHSHCEGSNTQYRPVQASKETAIVYHRVLGSGLCGVGKVLTDYCHHVCAGYHYIPLR